MRVCPKKYKNDFKNLIHICRQRWDGSCHGCIVNLSNIRDACNNEVYSKIYNMFENKVNASVGGNRCSDCVYIGLSIDNLFGVNITGQSLDSRANNRRVDCDILKKIFTSLEIAGSRTLKI